MEENENVLAYPYGFCGMPCALCTRYRTEGKSRCGGCSTGGYYTDQCRVYRCCKEKKCRHCGLCSDFICERLGKMGEFSDLRTNNAKRRTCGEVSAEGFEKWYKEYARRADMLTAALERYNNGRMKRYLCELFIQNSAKTLSEIMKRAENLSGDIKERSESFKKIAEELRVKIEEK